MDCSFAKAQNTMRKILFSNPKISISKQKDKIINSIKKVIDNGVYISAGSSSSNHILYVENQNSSAEYFAVRGDGEIRLNASSGHTYAARGIRFGANSTANNLDAYEEGRC